MGGFQKAFKPKQPIEFYNLPNIKKTKDEIREIKKEYTRMRDVFQKRLKRLAKNPKTANIPIVRKYGEQGFKKLSEIKSDIELSKRFTELYYLVTEKKYSLKGREKIKEKALETLLQHGFYFVNKDNYDDFGNFMGAMQLRYKAMQYDSKIYYEFFIREVENNKNLGEIEEAFKQWIDERNKRFELKQNQIPFHSRNLKKYGKMD